MTPQLYELQKSSLHCGKYEVEISHSYAHKQGHLYFSNSSHILWLKSFFKLSKALVRSSLKLFFFSKRFQFSGIVREFVWGGFFTIQFVQYLINLGQFIFREVVAVKWAALGRVAILTIE